MNVISARRSSELVGRRGSVRVRLLAPGELLPGGAADIESAVVVLSGDLAGLGEGGSLFLPAGATTSVVAGADGARVLVVRAPAAGPGPHRPAGDTDNTSAAVLAAGGGFADMSVRWLVDASASGSTALVVAASTFAPDGHHELHRHPRAEEFFLVVAGSGEHLTEDGAIRLGPGDAVLVGAGEWHGYRTDPGVTTTTIYGYLGAASLDDAGYEVCS
jgi:quercetin dioxygenase-like cupin family protein